MPNDVTDWRDDETYTEFKTRKHAERGLQGMGQKNVKNKENSHIPDVRPKAEVKCAF